MFDAVAERVEQYVVRVIKDQGADSKGKYRKLEGNALTLSLRKCPVSVDITDEVAVPEALDPDAGRDLGNGMPHTSGPHHEV